MQMNKFCFCLIINWILLFSGGLKYNIVEQHSSSVEEHEEQKYISADQEHNSAKIDPTATYIYRQVKIVNKY